MPPGARAISAGALKSFPILGRKMKCIALVGLIIPLPTYCESQTPKFVSV